MSFNIEKHMSDCVKKVKEEIKEHMESNPYRCVCAECGTDIDLDITLDEDYDMDVSVPICCCIKAKLRETEEKLEEAEDKLLQRDS